jgi:hypothetical protein
MKKFGLVLAAVAALALASMTTSQPAKAVEPLLVAGGLGWGYCHVTYGQKRKTPFCAWHDAWHKQYWGKKR